MADSDPSPPAQRTRHRGRRARPSKSRRAEVSAAAKLAHKEQVALRRANQEAKRLAAAQAAEAAEQAKVEAKKKQLVDLAEVERELLNAARPATLLEYCRARGIPDDVIYHPRYNLPKCPPDTPLQWVENFCFARDWPAEYGGLGAYRHLRNFISMTWPDIQWNDWLERMLRSLTDTDYVIRDGGTMVDGGSGSMVRVGGTTLRYVNWVGAGSCVAGHTRIYNPITGENPTIQSLCEQRISPWVLTVGGPTQAKVPFVRGIKPLYQVTLENGQSFQATDDHLVMLANGEFLAVSSLKIGQYLAGCDVAHPQSTSELVPSTRGVDALSFSRTAQDFQGDCLPYFHLCGEPLPMAAMGVRSFETSRADARIFDSSYVDSGGCKSSRSRNRSYRFDDHLSSPDEVFPSHHCGGYREYFPDEGMRLHGGTLFQSPCRSWSETNQQQRVQSRARDFARKPRPVLQSHWLTTEDLILSLVASPDGMVTARRVQAINRVGVAPFYDLQVPFLNHYFAEGVFHHNCGKTFAAGLFACAWFMFDCLRGKYETSITLTSTSKGIIAQRVWPVIQKCYHEARNADGSKMRWGHLVDSKKMVQAVKGDEKHSICALAVEPGDLQASLDKIKGRHTPRMMVVVDEANSTPQAIFECFPNMLTSVTELIVVVIGNAGSRLDPHGRCCEPRRGWKSITIDDDQWETKGVEQWGIGPGVCLHFDGARSPNVIAGRTEHKFIYSFERWQQVLRMGEEYRNTLQHWSQDRGFWPPDGLQTTVFTEALVVSHDGMGKFDWIDIPKPCAALDTAFGGDDCVYQPGLLGMVRGPKLALQLLPPVLVPFNPESTDSIDYQIAQWFISRCKKEKVEPEMAGLDASGTGRGVAAFVLQLWSPRIHAVEFGASASDMPASTTDTRASNEVYSNKVSELWYVCRELLTADQLKGLCEQAVKEFCSRTYEFLSRRYLVEPKRKMKIRLGYSPDHADATVVLVEVARRNGLKAEVIAGAPRSMRGNAAWEDTQRKIADLTTGDYSAANEFAAYADSN